MNFTSMLRTITLLTICSFTQMTYSMEEFRAVRAFAEAQSFFTKNWKTTNPTEQNLPPFIKEPTDHLRLLLLSTYAARQLQKPLNLQELPKLQAAYKEVPKNDRSLFKPYIIEPIE